MNEHTKEFFTQLETAKTALQRAAELENKIGFDYPCRTNLKAAIDDIEVVEERAGFGNSEVGRMNASELARAMNEKEGVTVCEEFVSYPTFHEGVVEIDSSKIAGLDKLEAEGEIWVAYEKFLEEAIPDSRVTVIDKEDLSDSKTLRLQVEVRPR